jgi:hypothetical protein
MERSPVEIASQRMRARRQSGYGGTPEGMPQHESPVLPKAAELRASFVSA